MLKLRRRRFRSVIGFFLMLLGLTWGMICFLRPRPHINVAYFSHQGTIWFENTSMSIGFFIGALGVVMVLEAFFSSQRARRRR